MTKTFHFPWIVRSVPPNATASQVQAAAKAISANRCAEDFCTWFLTNNPRGKGVRNLRDLSNKAAEFLLDLFISVRQNLGNSAKIPRGQKKYQVESNMAVTTHSITKQSISYTRYTWNKPLSFSNAALLSTLSWCNCGPKKLPLRVCLEGSRTRPTVGLWCSRLQSRWQSPTCSSALQLWPHISQKLSW